LNVTALLVCLAGVPQVDLLTFDAGGLLAAAGGGKDFAV
jgi:hypothetical protein